MSFTEEGSWSLGWWGQCGTSEAVTGTPRPDIQGSIPSLGGEFLRGPSGEPRFNAGLIKGTVGVPGRVGNPSHWTPHYGPPGQESLQPKRVPQINLQGGSRGMKKDTGRDKVSSCRHPRPPPHRVDPSASMSRAERTTVCAERESNSRGLTSCFSISKTVSFAS